MIRRRASLGLEAAKQAVVSVGLERTARWVWAKFPAEPGLQKSRADNRALTRLLENYLAPDSNCIDVGAARGSVLAEMIRVAPRGRHIAYEPIPKMFRSLQKRFPAVDVRQVALSDRGGESNFTVVANAPGYSGLVERDHLDRDTIEQITVRTATLDDDLPEDFVPALVKIDVEGAEHLVLTGGLRTLRAYRPLVVFEHGMGAADLYGSGPETIHRILSEEIGLFVYSLDGAGPFGLDRMREIFATGEYQNFVARPT